MSFRLTSTKILQVTGLTLGNYLALILMQTLQHEDEVLKLAVHH